MNQSARVSLAAFLRDLFETGRVRTPSPLAVGFCDRAADDVLAEFDRRARCLAPGDAPQYDASAARWGAETLFRACQFLVDRTAPPDVIAAELATRVRPADAMPKPALSAEKPVASTIPAATPAGVWSVDLTFQKLPDLHLLTRGLAVDDPLVLALTKLGADWPLSSVGVKLATRDASGSAVAFSVSSEALDAVFADPCLTTLYIDRVIARRDRSRLADPRALAAAKAAVGLYPDLVADWATLWERPGEASELREASTRGEARDSASVD